MSPAEVTPKTAYHMKADYVEACSCQHGCNCQFGGFPNEGICEFVLGWEVKDGAVGDVSLNGLRVALIVKYPNAIHEGNGHVVLFVDDKAEQSQVDALAAILSGKMGGMPWEALAGTVTRFEGPIRKPVHVELAGERSRVEVPGSIDVQLTPLKDPVTGADKAVHIVYPNGGFLWDDGTIATTDVMQATHGDLRFEWPHKYAAAAEINWTNQK
ncbi:MAG: DUF1326 domain-containing protein [Luteitalea sp.]|nr:DUF1326 domain-containing protein [Luteitalea sp.]